ncbi:hypothetical protein [Hyphobacterium indicum]|uniref:hypothetical protein n=1 Tax=Hyphobacterium indicum TaxID=2162714 RepID=UPI000D650597|nr:hypothetical protein [Hyphobacterium indicum]
MIELILALSLLGQDSDFTSGSAADTLERFGRLIDSTSHVAEDMEGDDSSLATARAMVDFVQAAFDASDPERFVLLDQDNIIPMVATELDNLMAVESEDDDVYDFEINAGVAYLPSGADTDGSYCASDDPGKAIDQPLTDPEGNELNLRVCWTGVRNPETGMLTGTYLYQLQSGNYVVQYLVSIIGSRESGMRPRLAIAERIGEPFVFNTVLHPVDAD